MAGTGTDGDDPFSSDAPLATQEWVRQCINMLDTVWQKMTVKLEERMETTDKVLGDLTLAYAKNSALLEAVISVLVMDKRNEELLNKNLLASMQKMKESLEHGQEDVNVAKSGFHPTGPIVTDGADTESEDSAG
jgi:hypothetical protein